MGLKNSIHKLRVKIATLVERIRDEEATSPSFWINWTRKQIYTYWYILKDLYNERCLREAASLTYTTLLSIVPLMAVAFSLFKAFNAFEGLDRKVEQAIFDKLLSPFVMTESAGPAEPEALPKPKAGQKALTPSDKEQLATRAFETAEKLPRADHSRQAFYDYMEALNLGYDAAKCRKGVSTVFLDMIPATSLRRLIGEVGPEGLAAYRKAAAQPELPGVSPDGPTKADVRKLLDTADKERGSGDYGGALTRLDDLEKAHASPWEILPRRARIYADIAKTIKDYDDAIQNYQDALLLLTDTVVVYMDHLRPEALSDLTDDHDEILQALAHLRFDRGTQLVHKAQLTKDLTEEQKAQYLKDGVAELEAAVKVLGNSSDVHLNLAEGLQALKDYSEARKHYVAAYRTANERAAKGFSSAIVDNLRKFIGKVNTASIGVVGVVFLVFTSISLLSNIEKTFNNIWRVQSRRPFWIKFTSFCTFLWLSPLMIGLSIWLRERVTKQVESAFSGVSALSGLYQFVTMVTGYVAPFLTIWLVLVAMYKFLPHTKVKLRHALWGAFAAGILLQLVRPLFAIYLRHAVQAQQIYGSLAAIPIFLLWIWLLWVIVLLGAEITYVSQNIQIIRLREKLSRLSTRIVDRFLALRLMFYTALNFYCGRGATSSAELAAQLDTTEEEINNACRRLAEHRQLLAANDEMTEFVPARDLADMGISEVLEVNAGLRGEYRSRRPRDAEFEKKLDELFDQVQANEKGALHDMTLYELVSEFGKDGRSEAEGATGKAGG